MTDSDIDGCLAAAAASRVEWENRVNGYSGSKVAKQDQRGLQDRVSFAVDMRRRGQVPPGYC